MIKRTKELRILAAILALALVAGLGAARVQALDLGSIIKVGGIGFLVDRFGPQINDAINTALGKNKMDPYDATKVVPIVSIGRGGYIGAAQVQGPQEAVDTVKAVGQIEVAFGNRTFRIEALVPVNSINPTNMSRVKGTGVSAVIDVKI